MHGIAGEDGAAGWARLHKALGKHHVVFILGAGVSRGSGLPTWEQLLEKLAIEVGIPWEPLRSIARARGWAWPTVTSLIRRNYVGDWPELVRGCLYGGFLAAIASEGIDLFSQEPKQPNTALAAFIRSRNPTLAHLVECCAERADERWRPNPRVRSILNYNIDALLQLYDRARHGSPRVLRTIERASARGTPEKTPLYHPHGFLRPKRTDPRDEAPDCLVLAEDEYHQRTDDAYGFATTSTLSALRECTCVFVGCSMSDELMRRALFRAGRERAASLEAEGANKQKRRRARHFAVVKRPDTPGDLEVKLVEQDLASLGVRALWVKDHERDLPGRLEELGTLLAQPWEA